MYVITQSIRGLQWKEEKSFLIILNLRHLQENWETTAHTWKFCCGNILKEEEWKAMTLIAKTNWQLYSRLLLQRFIPCYRNRRRKSLWKGEKDEKRDKRLSQLGVTVLRFDDLELRYDLKRVLETIDKWIDENSKR